MSTFATDREAGQMVGTATPPVTGAPFPAAGAVTTAGPSRLATARRALPHWSAHFGGSPLTRIPADAGGRGAEMTMPPPNRADGISDDDLLGGFASGDANAGGAFVRRFQGRVYGMAISLLGDRRLAEDVAQEAFVRACSQAATFDPEHGSVVSWLLRITRNLAIDAVRRPQAVDREMEAVLTPPNPAITVDDATTTSYLTVQLRAALTRLRSGQARALWLAGVYGHTAQEIAVSEGIPLGTAKTRIRQGLRAVREELTQPDGKARNE